MESAIQNLMEGFTQLGDLPHLFLFGGSYNLNWLAGIAYTEIGHYEQTRLVRLLKYGIGAVRAVANWRPDAIICADVTTIQMARFGRLFGARLKIPVASWLHFPMNEVRMKKQLRGADLHLAITVQMASDLKFALPVLRQKVSTIYNAIHIGGKPSVPRPNSAVFLYAGRLTFDEHKRVNDILEAVATLRGQWKLKIVGAASHGQEHQEVRLRALAETLGIQDRIEWCGWHKNLWDAAGAVTALVCSSAREAFGMVVAEACSHGVAVVSTACAGPMEIITHGRNGWLYPIGDVPQLAVRLQTIIDNPETLPPQADIKETVRRFSAEAVAASAKAAIWNH